MKAKGKKPPESHTASNPSPTQPDAPPIPPKSDPDPEIQAMIDEIGENLQDYKQHLVSILCQIKNGELTHIDEPDSRYSDFTTLHTAVALNKPAIVKLLLKHQANPDVQDINEYTPLHLAAQNLNLAIVQLLIDNKADIEKRNKAGETAFHIAIFHGQKEILALLLRQYGTEVQAKVKALDKSNPMTLFEFAVKMNRNNIVELLINQGIYYTKKSFYYYVSNLDIAIFLLKKGFDEGIQETDDQGKTVLHRIIYYSCTLDQASIQLLLNKGVDPNIQDSKDEDTVLHIAVRRYDTAVVELLLKNKVAIKINKHNQTPLQLAQAMWTKGNGERLQEKIKAIITLLENYVP